MGGDLGDGADAYLNQYDLIKKAGSIVGTGFGAIQGGYEYYKRQ